MEKGGYNDRVDVIYTVSNRWLGLAYFGNLLLKERERGCGIRPYIPDYICHWSGVGACFRTGEICTLDGIHTYF